MSAGATVTWSWVAEGGRYRSPSRRGQLVKVHLDAPNVGDRHAEDAGPLQRGRLSDIQDDAGVRLGHDRHR